MKRLVPFALILVSALLSCGKAQPTRPGPADPPVILSVGLTPWSVLSDSVTVPVTAEGADSVLLYDGALRLAADRTEPFELGFQTATLENGYHLLTARAMNRAGYADTTVQVLTGNPGRGLAVAVLPAEVDLAAGDTLRFQALVFGNDNHAVTWELIDAGGNAVTGPGQVDSDGLYTAPSEAQPGARVWVRAVSVLDPQTGAKAGITLQPRVYVRIYDHPPLIITDRSYTFAAKAFGRSDRGVIWRLPAGPEHGAIDYRGNYRAPGAVPDPQEIVVVAVSAADTTMADTVTVPIRGPFEVAITPPDTTVVTGDSLGMSAVVPGAPDPGVTWSVANSPTMGTITPDGMYHAPKHRPQSGEALIQAASAYDPRSVGTARVALEQGLEVVITSAPTEIVVARPYTFHARVDVASDARVTWSLPGGPATGTLDDAGNYRAPSSLPPGSQVAVRATSVEDSTRYDQRSIPIRAEYEVYVAPEFVHALYSGNSVQFHATVQGAPNNQVDWSVDGGLGHGTIDSNGNYVAPVVFSGMTITVRATSALDPLASGTATVGLVPHSAPGESAFLNALVQTGHDLSLVSDQVTGVVAYALDLAGRLSGASPTTGTLRQDFSTYTYAPAPADRLVIQPLVGPAWTVWVTGYQGSLDVREPESPNGFDFVGTLAFRATDGDGFDLTVSQGQAAAPGVQGAASGSPFDRTVAGRVSLPEAGAAEVNLRHTGLTASGRDGWSTDESVLGEAALENGDRISLDEAFTVYSFHDHLTGAGWTRWNWRFADSGAHGGHDYGLNPAAVAGAFYLPCALCTIQLDLGSFEASGTLTRDGTAYAPVHFDRVPTQMSGLPRGVLDVPGGERVVVREPGLIDYPEDWPPYVSNPFAGTAP